MRIDNKSKYIFIKKCDICKEKTQIIIFTIGLQNLVKCPRCGLIYLDIQRVDLVNLYNKNYYKNNVKNPVAIYCDYAIQEAVVKNKFKFAYSHIYKNYLKNKKVLEIGAGYGFFLKYLPEKLRFYAVEISKIAALEITKNKRNANVYNLDFMKSKINDNFDFIVSFDVIEHQNYLNKYLIKVHSLLNKNGTFLFTTPDYGTLLNKAFGVHAPAIQPMYHNYYFDQKWIRENLPKFGFKVIYLKTNYFEPMNVGTIIIHMLIAMPFLKKIQLFKIAEFLKVERIMIPFVRFGGIECILQKT